jgi:hypothetical protein
MIFSKLFSLCKNHDTILQKLKKMEEEFEDTKGRQSESVLSKKNTMAKRKSTKVQTTINKTYT